jgi:hypothetical protein
MLTTSAPLGFPSPWLSTAQAAQYCGYGVGTFERYRITGEGAIFSRVGRRVLYHVDDLDEWMRLGRRRSTSGPLIPSPHDRPLQPPGSRPGSASRRAVQPRT